MVGASDFGDPLLSREFFGVDRKKVGSRRWRMQKKSVRLPDVGKKLSGEWQKCGFC
jgi:hypothetical protein